MWLAKLFSFYHFAKFISTHHKLLKTNTLNKTSAHVGTMLRQRVSHHYN